MEYTIIIWGGKWIWIEDLTFDSKEKAQRFAKELAVGSTPVVVTVNLARKITNGN